MELFSYASVLLVNGAICLAFLLAGHSFITDLKDSGKDVALGYGLIAVGLLQAFNIIYSITTFLRRDEGGDLWIQ